ncbi:MAG: BON domain-containing protein [Alphaproteobacteria bacterium]|nr:BON domain-containing protein [Alphaproteobacteria bacterium]
MRNTKPILKILALSAFIVPAAAVPLAFGKDSAGQYIDDTAITAKVKTSLMTDSQLKGSDISVETTKGAVRLRGTVAANGQKSEAVRDADKVAGVQSVTDMLVVQNNKRSHPYGSGSRSME